MVTIDLYMYSGEPERVDKTLKRVGQIDGYIFMPVDYIHAKIKISNKAPYFNYCYVDKFNRYYFVENVTIDGQFKVFNLKLDALYTYRAEIKNANGVLVQTDTPNYLDTATPTYDQRAVITKLDFDDKLDAVGSIILVTIKGQ